MHTSLLDDDLRMFQSTFRKWLETEVIPHHAQWENDGICPRQIYKKAGDNGFLLITQPDKYGGLGLDFRFSAVLIEELAYAGATGLPLWLHSDIIAPYLEHFGSEEQKNKWLPKMAKGDVISAVAMTEPGAGSDLQGLQTTAVLKGDKWVINGSKTFISNAMNSDLVVVVAKTENTPSKKYAPLSLFLVERDAPGFERGRVLEKMGLKAQDTGELFFNNCAIPKENLLGTLNEGFIYMTKSLARERLCMAIHCVASARKALDLTAEYVKTRKAFGKSVSEFQNTRFKLSEAAIEIETCQAFVDRCIIELNSGKDITVEASMAKAKASEVLEFVADECLQLFGGYGYMLEYPISKIYADARVQRIFGGTTEIMKEIVARDILK
jgi:alkylation response protein AidB-like acyl-CoA dehydrogenase